MVSKKYVILRLGSVYGYSTDTARIDIMPNLFSKIASQNGVIKMFAGGRQIKSLVPLIDVARCFKNMEEKDDIVSETFNLAKDTISVKEVAEICKKYNPKVTLKETNDEVPNLGFSLSNKKILNTGFKFLYNLDQSIKEMISKWSKQDLIKDLEHVRDGGNEFIDVRGKISNHELTESINLIGLIDSKKGTIRANHYHPQQEQKCLFTKGQIIEIFQDILNPNAPKITQVVNEGQLSIIKPNVAHTMVFTKDTTFLNLVRGERDHENYGITHTIKHNFVSMPFWENYTNISKIQIILNFGFFIILTSNQNLNNFSNRNCTDIKKNILQIKSRKVFYLNTRLDTCLKKVKYCLFNIFLVITLKCQKKDFFFFYQKRANFDFFLTRRNFQLIGWKVHCWQSHNNNLRSYLYLVRLFRPKISGKNFPRFMESNY
mgnify:CR=1 FL=1